MRLQLARATDRYWHGQDYIDPSQIESGGVTHEHTRKWLYLQELQVRYCSWYCEWYCRCLLSACSSCRCGTAHGAAAARCSYASRLQAAVPYLQQEVQQAGWVGGWVGGFLVPADHPPCLPAC
jgi:hypothetical protein